MVADDTPAVQAVLKADTRRLKLLDEEKQLQARLEKGDDSVADRLEKVKQLIGRPSPASRSNSLAILEFKMFSGWRFRWRNSDIQWSHFRLQRLLLSCRSSLLISLN